MYSVIPATIDSVPTKAQHSNLGTWVLVTLGAVGTPTLTTATFLLGIVLAPPIASQAGRIGCPTL